MKRQMEKNTLKTLILKYYIHEPNKIAILALVSYFLIPVIIMYMKLIQVSGLF